MLNPDYLEHITDELMRDHIEKAVDDIISDAARRISKISDAARRISKTKTITETANWQVQKLEQLGAYHDYVLEKLSKAVNMSQDDLLKLFNDVAVETLREDDKIYRASGYDPVPLKDNSFMQRLIWSSVERTNGTLENLTRTTANTATRQFERILDQAHFRLASGAFSLQDVVRWGIKDLARNGIASIEYPKKPGRDRGHIDSVDVAFRRATLTGLNQAGLAVQERRAEEMGCDYVETTAHAGARPSHALWQGRVFKLHGSEPGYPNFYEETGYGTGAGLGGWNCRHGFYPFFPGLSELANTKEYLDELNSATVTYNGKEMSMYDATQEQRRIERNIRRWKREYKALSENGQDATEAAVKLRSWRERETDFLKQTELPRQGSREQVFGFGRSEASSASAAAREYYSVWSKSLGINESIEILANYYNVKYNNSPRYELLQKYVKDVTSGWVSPLAGFGKYEDAHNWIQTEIVGQKTSTGVLITGQSEHFIQRVVGTVVDPKKLKEDLRIIRRSGVEYEDILDAVVNGKARPIRHNINGNSQIFYNDNCDVSINPDTGVLIQCNKN